MAQHANGVVAAVLVLLVTVGNVVADSRANSRVELARNGKTEWKIFVPASAGAVEQFARDELNRYVEQICGARFAEADRPDQPFTIQIGLRSAISASAELPAAKPGYDGYAVHVSPESIVIAGDNRRGVVYGVYDLLEQLGCRWCYPTQDPQDPECVPKNDKPTLELRAWSVASPLQYRICNGSSWFFEMNLEAAGKKLDWAMKNRYNTMGWQSESKHPLISQYKGLESAGLFRELDRRGMLLHGPGHSFDHFLRAEDYMADHPEWFGLRDGKRVPQNFFGAQFCWSNAEARRQFVANVADFVRTCPRIDILLILSFDGGRSCACEQCKAAGASNLLMQLMGEVIDKLQTINPQLLVETVGGYEPMTEPPTKAEIHPRQRILWAHWGRHYRGGYGDADYDRRQNLETWRKAAKAGLTICQYYTDNFAEPWVMPPFADSLAADRKYFIENHVESVYMLMWPPGYWWNHSLNGCISGRCFYDASLDPFEQIRDFTLHYYGKEAGPLIGKYYEQWARDVDLAYRVKDNSTDADRVTLAEQRRNFIDPAIQAVSKDPVLAHRVAKVVKLHTLAERLSEGHRLRQQVSQLRESGDLAGVRAKLDEAKTVTDGIIAYFNTLADLNQGLIDKNEVPGFITLGVKGWIEEEAKKLQPTTRAAADVPQLPKIRVAKDHRGFVTDDGKPFVPFGVTYFRPGTGWAPKVWQQFDADATRRDFARMKELGVTCVRVFLSYGSFYREPGVIPQDALDKFDQFLDIAEHAGIYVHPTGPDHWEGLPNWEHVAVGEPRTLDYTVQFWQIFAARYRGRHVIFAYDLKNEPKIEWSARFLKPRWQDWLRKKYASTEQLAASWATTQPADFADIDVPAPKDALDSRAVLDFQACREEVADEWTRRQVEAIKAADPDALVTVGFLQTSVPSLYWGGIADYAAFRPARQAKLLDFLEIHFYPLANGAYEYRSEADELANLAYLEGIVREVARADKPVVLAEFGWYGGAEAPKFNKGVHPLGTEEQQAKYLRRAVETSAGFVCGWLNWGLHDHPGANDCTELTGLLTVDGRLKAWGKTFQQLSRHYVGTKLPPAEIGPRPDLDWDACLSSHAAAKQFRSDYLKAFLSDRPRYDRIALDK